MSQNSAAWIDARFVPLTVADAPFTAPEAGQFLVENRTVAVNPVDRFKQRLGNGLCGWIKYPFVLGFDLAGEVVAVGPDVTRFTIGDRVLGHATGMEKTRNRAAETAFQRFTIVLAHMASPIPDPMPFAAAAGYRVITMASSRNFSYVTGLGASEVFDYSIASVVKDVQRALAGRRVAGALAIGDGSAAVCMDVLATCGAPV